MKKVPPYGKPLYQLIKSGSIPKNDVRLFIGNYAWEKGKNFSINYPTQTLILPPWESAYSYDWPITQCDVLIFDTGYAKEIYIQEIAYCLFQEGANIVRAVLPDFSMTVYKRDI